VAIDVGDAGCARQAREGFGAGVFQERGSGGFGERDQFSDEPVIAVVDGLGGGEVSRVLAREGRGPLGRVLRRGTEGAQQNDEGSAKDRHFPGMRAGGSSYASARRNTARGRATGPSRLPPYVFPVTFYVRSAPQGPSLGGRSTVGQQTLTLLIGVRIPASQPISVFVPSRQHIPRLNPTN